MSEQDGPRQPEPPQRPEYFWHNVEHSDKSPVFLLALHAAKKGLGVSIFEEATSARGIPWEGWAQVNASLLGKQILDTLMETPNFKALDKVATREEEPENQLNVAIQLSSYDEGTKRRLKAFHYDIRADTLEETLRDQTMQLSESKRKRLEGQIRNLRRKSEKLRGKLPQLTPTELDSLVEQLF